MAAVRTSAAIATAIVALMVLSTLSGAATATAHPTASTGASAPAKAAVSTPHLPASLAGFSSTAHGLDVQSPTPSLPSTDSHLPAAPTAPADLSSSASAAPSARTATTLSALRTDGVPLRDAFLPNLDTQPHPALSASGTVVPSYTTGTPAPVGVAEYGITNQSGTLVPENLTTTELAGFFSSCNQYSIGTDYCTDPQVLAMDSGAPDAYGIQLNAVLQNVTLFNTPGYEFWTQNVLEYSTFSHQLYIITNIWNFSAYGALMSANAIAAHGANGTVVPGELYYSESGPFDVSDNFEAVLVMDSGVIDGDDAVSFHFYVENGSGNASWSGENDFAIFNSTGEYGPGVSTPAEYVASGSTYTPYGIPSDWEFVMGGPGGGSNLDVFSLFTEMDLYYLNASDEIAPVPSAYNVGSETGETSIGASTTWEGDFSPVIVAGPGVLVDPGPTIVEGMWNVTNSTQGVAYLVNELSPSNGFTFMATTTDPYDYAAYTWAPMFWLYVVSPADYGVWSLAANHDPAFDDEDLANGTIAYLDVALSWDLYTGVYTPLWALNETGLENITWNGEILFNNAYGPLGAIPFGPAFPFFAEMNDYAYPVFAGILLWYTYQAVISNPPTFTVDYPSWYDGFLDYYGLPESNQLPILVYDSEEVALTGATEISGWWFTLAFYGPTVPQYDVVFWNSSYSLIFNNNFLTSSNALYLYGGTDNEIFNNTFVQSFPAAPDVYDLSGAYYGTYALFEADYGDYVFGGELCDCWDVIYNNLFDTYFTAYSPLLDPYTGGYPILPFSEEWNVPYTPGIENIIGGDYLAGNYWWNYGTGENPYGVLPYDNLQYYYEYLWGLDPYGIFWGGDDHPLTPTPVYTVTFVEIGLPAGTAWTPEVLAVDGYYVDNLTTLDYANESWIAGDYNVTAFAFAANYSYVGISNFTVTGNETVYLDFAPDYAVTFHETGLPHGALWAVVIYGNDTFELDYSTTAYANFSLPNGTYLYDTGAIYVYYLATDEFAYFNVSGSALTIDLVFVPAYSVTIAETGLPAGGSWTFIWQISGPEGSNGSLTTNATIYNLGYGLGGWTIDWWASAPGYVATPASGSFVLHENTTLTIAFAASATIVFDETGLASGTAWTVSFTQAASTTTQTSTGSSMSFGAEDGTYSYTVSAADYVPTSASGTGTLPADTPVHVTFSAAASTVVFTPTGLPVGTDWTVNLTQGASTTSHTGTGALSIAAVDGSYSYTAASAGYTAAPASGSGVLPADASVTIAFSPTTATVAFSETGLPAGSTWTVEFTQGATTTDVSGSAATIDVAAVDGAYSYVVKAANYSAGDSASGSGSLPADATVSVTFAVVDGTVAGTVTPSGATLTVGSETVSLSGTGTYSTNLAPATYAVKVSAAGYYAYYTNVTVVSGKTTTLNVHLTAVPASPKPFLGVSSGTDWVLIAVLAALVLVLLGTTFVFMRRSRRPPQMTQYAGTSAAPAGAAGGAGAKPDWSESDAGSPPSGKS